MCQQIYLHKYRLGIWKEYGHVWLRGISGTRMPLIELTGFGAALLNPGRVERERRKQHRESMSECG